MWGVINNNNNELLSRVQIPFGGTSLGVTPVDSDDCRFFPQVLQLPPNHWIIFMFLIYSEMKEAMNIVEFNREMNGILPAERCAKSSALFLYPITHPSTPPPKKGWGGEGLQSLNEAKFLTKSLSLFLLCGTELGGAMNKSRGLYAAAHFVLLSASVKVIQNGPQKDGFGSDPRKLCSTNTFQIFFGL